MGRCDCTETFPDGTVRHICHRTFPVFREPQPVEPPDIHVEDGIAVCLRCGWRGGPYDRHVDAVMALRRHRRRCS